eukprot:9142463-Pyramimonas_sp.AAC.4
MTDGRNTIIWFRNGLRIHDNPALLAACKDATHVHPIYIMDPGFLDPERYGFDCTRRCYLKLCGVTLGRSRSLLINRRSYTSKVVLCSLRVGAKRLKFLLESLEDLDRRYVNTSAV